MLTAGQAIKDRMLIAHGDAAMATEAIRRNVEQYGPAPGAKKMLQWEKEAADLAAETGVYTVWRSMATNEDCTRVGPSSKCFCGHLFKSHAETRSLMRGECGGGKDGPCKCKRFQFIPRRPEEVGEWWLPRRKGFNINTYRAKCKCSHSHDEHMPPGSGGSRCRFPGCGCGGFQSGFLCVVCDKHWEEHETVVETEQERRASGKPVGSAFYPLADTPDIQELVFGAEALSIQAERGPPPYDHLSQDDQLAALRTAATIGSAMTQGRGGSKPWAPRNPMENPDKSVRLSAVNSGGKAPEKVDPRYAKPSGSQSAAIESGTSMAGRALLGPSSSDSSGGGGIGRHDGDGDRRMMGYGRDSQEDTPDDGQPGPSSSGESRKFCSECGTRAERPNAKFCCMCGHKLETS